jgi:Lrp/AsnC family transcriptional regulator, leucine-responsive regulatory protein
VTDRPLVIDETDLQILRALAQDARLSQRALGREVGMSSPAVAERLGKLEAAGVITGYRAVIDWNALGWGMEVVVDLISERSIDERELLKRALEIPEVEKVEVVTGSVDVRLRLRVRDHAHLQELFFERLLQMPGVRHTSTSLVMSKQEPENYSLSMIDQIHKQLGQ